ncbi:hypothetical protein F5146DRAFT_1130717 [Armillaria mellea]|nr:hypothetical protein F5146DRAFT_1130717 [Armillaria mellea]
MTLYQTEFATPIVGPLYSSNCARASTSKISDEVIQFGTTDPTWEQVNSSLPYLGAVVHETSRMHPPVSEATGVVRIPSLYSTRVPHSLYGRQRRTACFLCPSGHTVNSIFVAKVSILTATLETPNISEEFWDPNAKEFRPERWLEDLTPRGKEIQGPQHLLTFVVWPKIGLGRTLALAEFKASKSYSGRDFTFELPGGRRLLFVSTMRVFCLERKLLVRRA